MVADMMIIQQTSLCIIESLLCSCHIRCWRIRLGRCLDAHVEEEERDGKEQIRPVPLVHFSSYPLHSAYPFLRLLLGLSSL